MIKGGKFVNYFIFREVILWRNCGHTLGKYLFASKDA